MLSNKFCEYGKRILSSFDGLDQSSKFLIFIQVTIKFVRAMVISHFVHHVHFNVKIICNNIMSKIEKRNLVITTVDHTQICQNYGMLKN